MVDFNKEWMNAAKAPKVICGVVLNLRQTKLVAGQIPPDADPDLNATWIEAMMEAGVTARQFVEAVENGMEGEPITEVRVLQNGDFYVTTLETTGVAVRAMVGGKLTEVAG